MTSQGFKCNFFVEVLWTTICFLMLGSFNRKKALRAEFSGLKNSEFNRIMVFFLCGCYSEGKVDWFDECCADSCEKCF
jgi:hypothetical protein